MKTLRVVFIVACFIIIGALFGGAVSALDENEAAVTVTLSAKAFYRGEILGARVLFESKYFRELTVGYVGLHFDWMATDFFVGDDLSDDPLVIPSHGSYLSNVITIAIPENTTVGTHTYFVGVDGLQDESTGFSWDSQFFTVTVYGSEEELYSALLNEVAAGIGRANNANYQSSVAQSLLEQAQSAYAQAVNLAAEDKLGEALSELSNASTLLEQADVEEQNYVESSGSYDLLLAIVLIVVVAVLVIVLIVRRKGKRVVRRKKK